MAAFKNGYEAGVDGFEIDVRLTADEEIVVMHDLYVDRTSDGAGKVSALRLDELRALDFGYHFKGADGEFSYRGDADARVVTLRELLEAYPSMLINIDIKDEPNSYVGLLVPRILSELIEEFEAEDRVLVTSFYDDQIERFKLHSGGHVATGAGVDEVKRGYFMFTAGFGHLYSPNADSFQIPTHYNLLRLDGPNFIQYLKRLNVVPGYWTINNLDEITGLIERGAHTIVTDFPGLTEHIRESLD